MKTEDKYEYQSTLKSPILRITSKMPEYPLASSASYKGDLTSQKQAQVHAAGGSSLKGPKMDCEIYSSHGSIEAFRKSVKLTEKPSLHINTNPGSLNSSLASSDKGKAFIFSFKGGTLQKTSGLDQMHIIESDVREL